MMDLSLSVDNVVAAVAMSPKLWVVYTGVFIGILALRFVAGACLKVIDRYPILEETAKDRHSLFTPPPARFLQPGRGSVKHWEPDDPQSRNPFPDYDNVFTD